MTLYLKLTTDIYSLLPRRYQVLFFVVTYAVPMLGMTFFYSAMGKVLWGSGSIGELTQRQVDSIKSKRKVKYVFLNIIYINYN